MTYWLERLEAGSWAGLRDLGANRWFWTDIEGAGAHLTDVPPQAPPQDATLLWGWGPDVWVRVRCDTAGPDEPPVGAILRNAEALPPHATEASVTHHDLVGWTPEEKRIRLDPKIRAQIARSPRAYIAVHETSMDPDSGRHWTELHFFSCNGDPKAV